MSGERERPGFRYGRYEASDTVARGALGIAYRARRDDGSYDQDVALEVFHPPAPEALEVRRARLAGLEHANLCRLLDAGTGPDGEAFLVFERPTGALLVEHCRERDLDWRERVALLVAICRACEAAHQRLVVHGAITGGRARVDGFGQARLDGFGLASLERLGREGARPDLRVDVRQLALLANEVLGIGTPDRPRLPKDLRSVLDLARGSRSGHGYGSARELADDLDRARARRPVTARSGSKMYEFGCFLRRQRTPVLLSTTLSLLILAMTVGFVLRLEEARDRSARAAEEARLEQARAETARDDSSLLLGFVIDLFANANPRLRAPGELVTPRELLGRAEDLVEAQLGEQPRVSARMWAILGKLRRRMGDPAAAVELHRRSLEASERVDLDVLGERDPEAAQTFRSEVQVYRQELANALNLTGRAVEGAPILEAAAQELAVLYGESSVHFGHAAHNLSLLLHTLQRSEEGLRWARRAEAAYRGLGREDWVTGSLEAQGLLLSGAGRSRDAVPLLRATVEYRKLHRPGTPSLSNAHLNLGALLVDAGRPDEGVEQLEQALEVLADAAAAHPQANSVRLHLIGVLLDQGRRDEAEAEIARLDPDPSAMLPWMESALLAARATLALRQGRLGEALRELPRAVDSVGEYFGDGHQATQELRARLGEAHRLAGAVGQAEAILDEVVASFERNLGPEHPGLAPLLELRADWALQDGRTSDGYRDLRRAAGMLRASQYENGGDRRRVEERLLALGGWSSTPD